MQSTLSYINNSAFIIGLIAQNKFTAVGRVERNYWAALSKRCKICGDRLFKFRLHQDTFHKPQLHQLQAHLAQLKQNLLSEFNIWTDPVAVQKVFSAGLPISLTPLDATNQIGFTRADQAAWKATGTPESILASQLLDYALTNISGNDPLIPNPAWDLVAAINLSEPSFCQPMPLNIEVNTDGKPEVNQGQTLAIPNQPPNTNVCLNPSLANLPFTSQELAILG